MEQESKSTIENLLAATRLPDQMLTTEALLDLHYLLVPEIHRQGQLDPEQLQKKVEKTALRLQAGLANLFDQEEECEELVASLVEQMPHFRRLLLDDALFAYERDPSVHSPVETLFCFPGCLAVSLYRIAHFFQQRNLQLVARMLSEKAHSLTGIDINPAAEIGSPFFIDHGTGVVIGGTCVIGDRVCLYQGVTLGAKSIRRDKDGHVLRGVIRHPKIEDDVTVYSQATILGPINVGRGSVIGGNVWLTESVPSNSLITQMQFSAERFESGAGI